MGHGPGTRPASPRRRAVARLAARRRTEPARSRPNRQKRRRVRTNQALRPPLRTSAAYRNPLILVPHRHANAETGQGSLRSCDQRMAVSQRGSRREFFVSRMRLRQLGRQYPGVRSGEHAHRRRVADGRGRRNAGGSRPRRRHPLAVVAEGGAADTDAAVAAARRAFDQGEWPRTPPPNAPRCCAASRTCCSATARRSRSSRPATPARP